MEDTSDLYEDQQPETALSNVGDFFWITEKNDRKSKIDKHELKILHFDGNGVSTRTMSSRGLP